MRSEIDNYELIEQYLSGKLSEEEIKNFESMMAESKEFAEEVGRHKQIFSLVIDASMAGIRDQITSIHEYKTVRYKIRRKKIRIAAAVITGIVTLGILTFLLLNKNRKDSSITPPAILPEKYIAPTITPDTQPSTKIMTPSGLPEAAEDKYTVAPGEKNLTTSTLTDEAPKPVNSDSITKLNEHNVTPDRPSQDLVINENEEVPVPEKIDCNKVNLTARVKLEKSCSDQASGVIHIEESSLGGGTPPYEISIDNQANYAMQYHFDQLLPVRYSIWIRDKNKCSSWLGSYLIESVDCTIQDKFAPDLGETWEIPHKDQSYTIKIYNQRGNLVYEASSEKAGTDRWDGNDNAGSALPMGIYTFIMTLENGSVQPGTITIIR